MNIAEWSEWSGIKPTTPTSTGAISVVIDHTNAHRPHLWQLDDYAVSSINGIVIWLTPRTKIDNPASKVQVFAELSEGSYFRFVGGVTIFVKVAPDWVVVDGKPNIGCHVPPYKDVVPTGAWTNLIPN